MDLHAPPFNDEIELLLQLFDDTLADVAERSDVVGKEFNADGHGTQFPRNSNSCEKIMLYFVFICAGLINPVPASGSALPSKAV